MRQDLDIRSRLQAFLEHELPGCDPRVSNLVRTSTGRSRQNWAFDLDWRENGGNQSERLILRCDPPGGLVQTDRSLEFAVLQVLAGSPVPAPQARWIDVDGTWFDRPALIMRQAPGICDYYVLSGSRPEEERVALARRFCELLAQLHLFDWPLSGPGSVLTDPGDRAADAELSRWEAVLRSDQREPYPELELGIAWLRERAPSNKRTVLVHGDFKPGNVLIDPADPVGGPLTLLDWELAHLGDPAEDLGWMTQPLRHREHFVAGRWETNQIVEHYEAATGWQVDADAVQWWAMLATFRTAVMQVSGLRAFLEGSITESYRPTAPVLRTLVELIDR